MNTQQAANIIKQAYEMASNVTNFYAKSVGFGINSNEEFCILVEWQDAIDAATAAALSIRSWNDVSDMDAMNDECGMYFELWKKAA